MSNKRFEYRNMCADLVTLEWRERPGFNRVISAVLEDISPQGACLQTEDAVPLGLIATVRHDDWVAECEVCYCTYLEIGFYVGLKFDANTLWSKNIFEPGHFLDVATLPGVH